MKYEISSYSNNLEFALTNPIFTSPKGYFWSRNWTESQSKWRSYMREGIIYNENHYVDVEQAYQLCKPKNLLFDSKTKFDVMLELLIIKLQTYPKLIEGIDFKGGLDYLNNCTHQPTKQNTCWETGGQNMFIKLLIEAYKTVKNGN